MGMSSSQARLLNLTGRMHQIEYKAAKLEAEKLQMANESRRVYNDYQHALEKKKLQFLTLTNNGSIDYADATLAGLENAIVHDTSILTSAKAYLLQNVNTNEIYLTQQVADGLGITATTIPPLPDKTTYLNSKGVYQVDEMKDVTNYDKVISAIPVTNEIQTGSASVPATYSYSISSGSIAVPDTSGSKPQMPTTYTSNGAVSVPDNITSPSYCNFIKKVNQITDRADIPSDYLPIYTVEDLINVGENVDCILMNDIDLSSYIAENGWVGLVYTGGETFNGNGHVIKGLNTTDVALFSYVENATICNLGIEDSTITQENADNVGFLISKGFDSTCIDNCYVNNSRINISNFTNVGGFIGLGENEITIINSYSNFEGHAQNHDGGFIGGYFFSDMGYLSRIENCCTNQNNLVYITESAREITTINSDTSVNPQDYVVGTIKGDIVGAYATEDIKKYLAYQMYNTDSSKSFDVYYDQLNTNLGNDAYKYISLSTKINPNDESTLIDKLIAGDYSDANTFTSSNYNIVNQKTAGEFNVIKNEGSEAINKVTVSSLDDIINVLAVGVHNELGSAATQQELSVYGNKIRANFSDEELASLSQYLNDSNQKQAIIEALAQGNGTCAKASVQALNGINLTTFEDYSITYNSNNIVVNNSGTPGKPATNDTIVMPQTSEIASNLIVAFRKAGKTVDNESALSSKLASGYGNDLASLAEINNQAANAVNSGSLTSLLNSLYDYLCGTGSKPSVTPLSGNYDYTQVSKGKCQVEYGTKPEKTGRKIWNTSDPNYIKYSQEYDALVALRNSEVKFKIIDDDLANSKDYLNELFANDAFVLIDYEKGFDEDTITHTSVAVDTNLQEVDDESELRKAEAKYEADMRRIDMKDRKYDYDLAALDNERNAIKNEMETLKTVAKENVDRTFKLFG